MPRFLGLYVLHLSGRKLKTWDGLHLFSSLLFRASSVFMAAHAAAHSFFGVDCMWLKLARV